MAEVVEGLGEGDAAELFLEAAVEAAGEGEHAGGGVDGGGGAGKEGFDALGVASVGGVDEEAEGAQGGGGVAWEVVEGVETVGFADAGGELLIDGGELVGRFEVGGVLLIWSGVTMAWRAKFSKMAGLRGRVRRSQWSTSAALTERFSVWPVHCGILSSRESRAR
jgi:hypothetical protein